jgi:hypothetical protein
LIGFLGGVFLVFGLLPVVVYLFSRCTIYHFDRDQQKIRIETYNRIRRLPEKEIPFQEIEAVRLEKKQQISLADDEKTEKVTTTLALFVDLSNKPPLLLQKSSQASAHSEIERLARRVAEMTGAKMA